MRFLFLFILMSSKFYCQTDTTEHLCEYPGGIQKVNEIIKKNLIYPKSAIKDNVSGKSTLKFTVDTLGNVTDILIAKSLRGDCDTAAINALKHLGRWTPGTMKGKKVPVTLTIPIVFTPPSSPEKR